MAHPQHHKATPQHATGHDDPVTLDIDSLLELQLKHTEDTEQHRDHTLPGPEPMANNQADPNCADSPQSAPPPPPPHEQGPWTHLPNALRCHHPTHEASKGPDEYQASLEHVVPDNTQQGLHGYTTMPPPGTPAQEWEEEYAVEVTDMTAYMESVEDPEQDTILSLLAYHSWRWGHQVTLH